jgi:DNA recombination protein RmuC
MDILAPALGVVGALALGLWLGRRLGQAGSSGELSAATQQVAFIRERLAEEKVGTARLRHQLDEAVRELAARQAESAGLSVQASRVPELEEKATSLVEAQAGLQQQVARLTALLEEAEARGHEREALLAQAEARFREAFQALSAEALKGNNAAFLDLARSALGEFQQGARADLDARRTEVETLVAPIRESLGRFDAAVQGIEKERLEAYVSLKEQVLSLSEGQTQLRGQTAALVNALRAPAVRGRWGEFQLRRLVEMAGMIENCDFVEQAQLETPDGRLRPDVLVHIPGGKTIVIDSKVPLAAYLEALEADDEQLRRDRIRAHALQVRKHVELLGGKAYASQLSSSPDFVVMYLPLESAFAAALQEDPGILDFAADRCVIPAGPMTLLTHLKAAAYGWRQERIASNAERISELGRDLFDRIATLASHFADVGSHLGRAVDAYNRAVGSLERRVLTQARRFKELGAATGDMPEIETVGTTPRQLHASEAGEAPSLPPSSAPSE